MGQQFQQNMVPGRVVKRVERYHLPSGRYREFRHVSVTGLDAQGVFRTDDHIEVVPPLDCSCIPDNMKDVVECTECLAVVCASKHSATCPECGRVFCSACLNTIEVNDDRKTVCQTCRRDLTVHPVMKLVRKIWEIPQR